MNFRLTALVLVLTFSGCASQPGPVPTKEGARVETPAQCRDVEHRGGNC